MSVADLLGSDANQANFEHRRLLMQAYQASGIGKANPIAEYLLDWLAGSGTQKILVFAHHRHVMDTLEQAVAKKYKGVGHIRIDGTVPSNERAARVRKFQTNSQVRVAILSMTAAGVGLTLTAASSVLFAELHWTPGVLAQAEDRCHRIGQQNAVNIMYCVCKDETLSVDMRLWAMLGRKVGTLGKVIDGCHVSELEIYSVKKVSLNAANVQLRCLTKSASMNASESMSRELSSGRSTPSQSVEDELSRFFAETSANERRQFPAPVKGSILSFFKRPEEPQTTSSRVSSTVLGAVPTNMIKCKPKPQPPQQEVQWSCESCTFINSRKKAEVNEWIPCEMCGDIYIHEDSRNDDDGIQPLASPALLVTHKVGGQNDVGNVIDIIGSSRSPGKRNQDSSEVIVVDLDEPDSLVTIMPRHSKRGRRSSGACPSDVIEIDIEVKQEAFSSSPKVSIIDPCLPVSHSVVTPVQTWKVEKTHLLTFAVSKNSGRVSIHRAETGESFHFNFDINEIVTKETADSLLNAEVKRSSSKAQSSAVSPTDIKFCDDSVKGGMYPISLFCFRSPCVEAH